MFTCEGKKAGSLTWEPRKETNTGHLQLEKQNYYLVVEFL